MIPSRETQQEYARRRRKINAISNSEAEALQSSEDLLDALLHRAFRRELSLNETAFEDKEADPSRENSRSKETRPASQVELFN
jgi:hypothetical protein